MSESITSADLAIMVVTSAVMCNVIHVYFALTYKLQPNAGRVRRQRRSACLRRKRNSFEFGRPEREMFRWTRNKPHICLDLY